MWRATLCTKTISLPQIEIAVQIKTPQSCEATCQKQAGGTRTRWRSCGQCQPLRGCVSLSNALSAVEPPGSWMTHFCLWSKTICSMFHFCGGIGTYLLYRSSRPGDVSTLVSASDLQSLVCRRLTVTSEGPVTVFKLRRNHYCLLQDPRKTSHWLRGRLPV